MYISVLKYLKSVLKDICVKLHNGCSVSSFTVALKSHECMKMFALLCFDGTLKPVFGSHTVQSSVILSDTLDQCEVNLKFISSFKKLLLVISVDMDLHVVNIQENVHS